MNKISNIKIREKDQDVSANDKDYVVYPEKEDIYSMYKESDLDPDDITKVKKLIPEDEEIEDLDDEFLNDVSGSDLDIPGSEIDDDQEITGNEDEENNYYSLGGDNHNDLDEDQDDM
jgi:hypothetical protein